MTFVEGNYAHQIIIQRSNILIEQNEMGYHRTCCRPPFFVYSNCFVMGIAFFLLACVTTGGMDAQMLSFKRLNGNNLWRNCWCGYGFIGNDSLYVMQSTTRRNVLDSILAYGSICGSHRSSHRQNSRYIYKKEECQIKPFGYCVVVLQIL